MASDNKTERDSWFETRAHFLNEVNFSAGFWKDQATQSERGAIDFALEGIRSIYLLHGGGVGVVAAATGLVKLPAATAIWLAVPFFAGLVGTLLCNLCAYFAQIRLTESHVADYWKEFSEANSYYYPDHEVEKYAAIVLEQGSASERAARTALRWRNGALALAVFALIIFVSRRSDAHRRKRHRPAIDFKPLIFRLLTIPFNQRSLDLCSLNVLSDGQRQVDTLGTRQLRRLEPVDRGRRARPGFPWRRCAADVARDNERNRPRPPSVTSGSQGARRRSRSALHARCSRGLDGFPGRSEASTLMAGSFIDRTDPSFDDLGRREVINLRCKCGREVQIAPFQLIGRHGVRKHTKVWSLRDRFRCTKCRRRPPKDFWVAKWQD